MENIILNSPSYEYKKLVPVKITNKIVISSLIESKIILNFNDPNFNKDIRIGAREGAWIRIYDKNDTYVDYVAIELLFIKNTKGILLQSAGEFYKIDADYTSSMLTKLIKDEFDGKLSKDFIFNYRKKIGAQIKKDFNFILKRKNDISIDKYHYQKEKNVIFKRMLEFSIVKQMIDNSWKLIEKNIKEKLRYE